MAVADVLPLGDNPKALKHEEAYFARARATWANERRPQVIVMHLLFNDSPLVCSSCVIRKSAFEAIRGFDVNIALCEDVEMYLRAIRTFGFVYIPLVLLERRCGITSLTTDRAAAQFRESYRIIYAEFSRPVRRDGILCNEGRQPAAKSEKQTVWFIFSAGRNELNETALYSSSATAAQKSPAADVLGRGISLQ